mgnify:CR=1 FL=1
MALKEIAVGADVQGRLWLAGVFASFIHKPSLHRVGVARSDLRHALENIEGIIRHLGVRVAGDGDPVHHAPGVVIINCEVLYGPVVPNRQRALRPSVANRKSRL